MGGEAADGQGEAEQPLAGHAHQIGGAEILGEHHGGGGEQLAEAAGASEGAAHLGGHIAQVDGAGAQVLVAELLQLLGLAVRRKLHRGGCGNTTRRNQALGQLAQRGVGEDHAMGSEDLGLVVLVGGAQRCLVAGEHGVGAADALAKAPALSGNVGNRWGGALLRVSHVQQSWSDRDARRGGQALERLGVAHKGVSLKERVGAPLVGAPCGRHLSRPTPPRRARG